MRYQTLPADLYVRNRARFAKELPDGAATIVFSNGIYSNNADASYRFTQDSHLHYLTGIDQEECALLIFPSSPKPELREVLFIRRTSPTLQLWEGWKYSPEEASAQSGIQTIRYYDELESVLRQLVQLVDTFYLTFNEHERNVLDTLTPAHQLAHRLQREFPAHRIARAWPILTKLRMQKQPEEIAQIRRACAITEAAFRRVLGFVKPGVLEYEVEAEIIHEFIRRGATGHAYEPIIGSGNNAVVLHYNQNEAPCKEGDILLMDFGAEYGGYSSDLTRSIPVSGRFTDRQHAVYQAVLDVKNFAQSLLRPGAFLEEYQKEVGLFMQEKCRELGLITEQEIAEAPAHAPAYKKYFPHGTSHHLGLDTHDVHLKHLPLQPGMVLTVEPGLYIPEENLGIRLEDDVLITENGIENLMASIPLDIADIETLMGN